MVSNDTHVPSLPQFDCLLISFHCFSFPLGLQRLTASPSIVQAYLLLSLLCYLWWPGLRLRKTGFFQLSCRCSSMSDEHQATLHMILEK